MEKRAQKLKKILISDDFRPSYALSHIFAAFKNEPFR